MPNVFLPKTNFSLYSDFHQQEEKLSAFWDELGIEGAREKKRLGEKKFIVHDGPPYANGPIHMGHAENKIWKDIINKIFWQSGFDTPFIPGWDAHGLPIENAIEKQLKEEKIERKELSRSEFWDKCYNFATFWMEKQKQGFKRLGVFGKFDKPYATIFENESIGIMEAMYGLVESGLIERKFKPVLWSPAEKTALAYAEVEYKEKNSYSIYITFSIISSALEILKGAELIIWTTTPWTLPANQSVAYNRSFDYVVFEVNSTKYCCSKVLFEQVKNKFTDPKIISEFKGEELNGTVVDHPISEFFFPRCLIHSNHVDNQKGTGFVHIAPAHGEDDFILGKEHNLKIEDILDNNGLFKVEIPCVGGKTIKEADSLMVELLKERSKLIYSEVFKHSYPHSWRSKAPLIYRLTPQWFLSMEPLKKKALAALNENLKWVPPEGKNRFVSMLESREDWCISRQRMWGVPLGIFFNKETYEVIKDPAFLRKTLAYLKENGVKNWWNLKSDDIDTKYSSQIWQRADDIMDVWFESGATQYFVLQKNDLFPADVYLEGSDQHRAWFQSSLLLSAFQKGVAPWKNLLTHGFVLDADKQKMSKSLGNVIDPVSWGADELRVFFSSVNICEDISLTKELKKRSQEIFLRFRNTWRFMIGILNTPHGTFDPEKEEFPLLEKWILHRLTEIDEAYDKMLQTFEIWPYMGLLYEFCAQDLSAFYFDIRKDTLYCDVANSPKRSAVIQCMKILIDYLLKWSAPILCYSAEEAWQELNLILNRPPSSIHLEDRPCVPSNFKNSSVSLEMVNLRAIRKLINLAVEDLREKKVVSTTQEVKATIFTDDKLEGDLIKEIAMVAVVEIKPLELAPSNGNFKTDGCAVFVEKHIGEKCARCRFVKSEMKNKPSQTICERCIKAEEELC